VKYTLQVVNEASVIFSEIREFHIPNELRDEFFETKKCWFSGLNDHLPHMPTLQAIP